MPHTNKDRREEILLKELDIVTFDFQTKADVLQAYLNLSPSLDKIKNAMDENGRRMCLELLEYMAKNDVDCEMLGDSETDTVKAFFYFKGQWIKKEQLFENFL